MEQLTLPLPEQGKQPFSCQHELSCVDMSGKGNIKSCCDLTVPTLGHPTWTNCRVWGSCTMVGDAE